MKVRFWGVRGSCAAPGPATARYGGNTSCVEVRLDDGQTLILDSGTGIRPLGGQLMRETGGKGIQATLLVSHFHWDHIQGFPFFTPAYVPGNEFKVLGAGDGSQTEEMFVGQMQDEYFPVPLKAMGSDLSFQDLNGGTVEVGRAEISCARANHPGLSLAFKIKVGNTSIVYASDHEFRVGHKTGEPVEGGLPIDECDGEFLEFLEGVDLYIGEGQYTPDEYRTRVGWGHSIWQDTLDVVAAVKPARFAFYHHDPEHSDQWVDRQLHQARTVMAERSVEGVEVVSAYEGMTIELPE